MLGLKKKKKKKRLFKLYYFAGASPRCSLDYFPSNMDSNRSA